jgi:S1-C subfamily serine protease
VSTHDPSVPPGSPAGRDPEGVQPSGTPAQPAPPEQGFAAAPTTPLTHPAAGATQQQPAGWASQPSAPQYPGAYSGYGQPYGSAHPYSGQPYGAQPSGATPSYGYPGAPATAPAPVDPAARRRSGRVRMGVAGLVAGALIGGGAGAGAATLVDDSTTTTAASVPGQSVVIQDPKTATTATAAAAKAAPSVVTIYVANSSGSGSGSGVVLTEDGYVVTNNHVVTLDSSGAGTVQVRVADGKLYDAKVVGTDPASDLAVVKVDGVDGLVPATFANSDKVQVGDVAVAIGAPLGLSNTVTDGIISATGRAVATGSTQDDATVIDALQTDAAINPGNSGGALVNGAGEVMGINTAIATVASGVPGGQSQSGNIGVGFAIPSNTADRIAKELIKDGKATRAFLGVSAQTDAADGSTQVGDGAVIVKVTSGGAAEKAGLRVGDVVTAVDDRPVTTSTELTAGIRAHAPGDTVTLTVRRGNDTQQVDVTLGSTQ